MLCGLICGHDSPSVLLSESFRCDLRPLTHAVRVGQHRVHKDAAAFCLVVEAHEAGDLIDAASG